MEHICKNCFEAVVDITNEGLRCHKCDNYVHFTCLKRGSTPGALCGDVFFKYTCTECSVADTEIFKRDSQKWFQVIVLTFYHLDQTNKALSRTGFYHWKIHVAAFIDKHWEIIFGKSVKQKRNWKGTISGTLSNNSPLFFTKYSGFNYQGWWSLTYPKLSPGVTVKLFDELSTLKSTLRAQKIFKANHELLEQIITSKNYDQEYKHKVTMKTGSKLESDAIVHVSSHLSYSDTNYDLCEATKIRRKKFKRPPRKVETISNPISSTTDLYFNPSKRQKFDTPKPHTQPEETLITKENVKESNIEDAIGTGTLTIKTEKESEDTSSKLLDPLCHYNTSIKNLYMLKCLNLTTKLMGGLRIEPILSPYSNLYLKPYIHRDGKNMSKWLKLMAQIQLKANEKVSDYVLPSRGPIDYVYVQPSHIPAINSLCNTFFWPGIDLTECLQYPDFTCVVMYKHLVIGFAVIVPDVKVHENYISFIFVRPGWRNIGIGRFMLYHLIQTSMGKDITLHVSINNPALLLYQKFGFKVENVELNFYEKYLRNDASESKHAFFCRLER